ncbi:MULTISPECIES: SsrA-binding protein SmpB [Azospirillaceae]|uniref:SsrA-binding protein SmpB n=1 Tax=Azospirillaceae TaxID=2829815 RepID=UPI000B6DAE88|nr:MULTISPECIES: SsrA-binding protein SmpB [Azospirillaceae]MDG5493995.1 SsrA-binding protein SmpB [Niveispirillum sp. BGYR6]SNS77081.1 SsrA-binding protein [Azospirillum sp. RU38E]SNS94250.1 SsrA-binding protein [Azospirillum sp. RU37A]
MAKAETDRKVVAQNRRARFDYFIEDTVEAGIMLLGTEVKSLRSGKASIVESYAGDQNGELFLVNAYIPEYGQAGQFFQHETKRPRKLLVRKRELARMLTAIQREGMTLIPMSIYFNDRGKAKVELGIAKGKKKGDKREAEKERDWQRDKARLMRARG